MAGDFIDFAALWPTKNGRGHRGGLDRRADAADVLEKLQAGWSILLFPNDNAANDRAPSHRLVLAPPMERNEAHGHRRDAPSSHVSERQGRASLDAQRPRGGRGAVDDLSDGIPFAPCWEA
jgi:hypothetical protein